MKFILEIKTGETETPETVKEWLEWMGHGAFKNVQIVTDHPKKNEPEYPHRKVNEDNIKVLWHTDGMCRFICPVCGAEWIADEEGGLNTCTVCNAIYYHMVPSHLVVEVHGVREQEWKDAHPDNKNSPA